MSNQPNLISGLVNGLLVFCGLIVAGILTLLGSSHVESPVVLWFGTVALGLALVGGIFALLSLMNAINLGRREEKASDPRTVDDNKRISSARKWSLNFSEWSFFVMAFGSVAVFVFVLALHWDQHGKSVVVSKFVAVDEDGSELLSVDGDIDHVSVVDRPDRCEIFVETRGVSLQLAADQDCSQAKFGD